MRHALVLSLLAWALSPRMGVAQAPSPPLPSPAVPEASRLAPPAAAEVPPRPNAKARAKKPGPPKIVLGEKHESHNPGWAGAGVITQGDFKVKADAGKLSAIVGGAADSHAFFGVHSLSVVTFELVQEFEIVADPETTPQVTLVMSGQLDGYVRSEKHSAACLRRADAVVYSADGERTIGVGFPPRSAAEGSGTRCDGETETPPIAFPPGRYVLVVTLVLETTAGGLFRGHSVAVFTPDFRPGEWRSEVEEIEDLDEADTDGFGFGVTLQLNAPRSD